MRENDLPAVLGRIRKMKTKAIGVLLAVTLVTASLLPNSVTATEVPDLGGEATKSPASEAGEEATIDTDSELGEEAAEVSDPESDEEAAKTPTPEPGEEAAKTPTPVPEEEVTGVPTGALEEDGEELTATPKPTKEPKPTATPKPTKEPKPTATPKPTKEPKPTATPKPTKEPVEEDEVTPTPKPTKKPKATPTPKPGEGEAEDPNEESTEDPNADPNTDPAEDPDADPNEEPTPTPKPVYPIEVPTESNDARYQYLFGINAREITIHNPIPGYESAEAVEKHLKSVTVKVWKMKASGSKYSSTYTIRIHEKLVRNIRAIFKEIYALDIQFPIKEMKAYTYFRKVGGVGLSNTTLISPHSLGAAIDINPGDFDNDYFLGKGNDLRDKSNPYCIPDEVIEIFAKYGWFWGGDFDICADTMHFQYLGLDSLSYQNNPPFRDLKVQRGYMKGIDVRNLQQRLCEVGYKVTIDGVYGNKTASAVKKYQKNRGLPATGVVDYKTWETIINETHYMSYVF